MHFLQKKPTCLLWYQIHYTPIRLEQQIMSLNINAEQKHLNNLFFPWTITERDSLDLKIQNSFYTAFKKHFTYEFRPVPNSVFNIHDQIGIKLLTRLTLGLSHLNEHRFNHIFQNCKNPQCICSSSQQLTSSCIAIFTFPSELPYLIN